MKTNIHEIAKAVETLFFMNDVTDVNADSEDIRLIYKGVRMILLIRYAASDEQIVLISPYNYDFLKIISVKGEQNMGSLILDIENSLDNIVCEIKDRLFQIWIDNGQEDLG